MKRLVMTTYKTSLELIFAGKLDKKYISEEKSSVFVKFSKKFLRVLIFKTKNIPNKEPIKVPKKPIVAPFKKNIFIIVFWLAPIVLRIAISICLFLTSIIKLEIMLKAATKIIRLKIKNITFFSVCIALKKASFENLQSYN